MTIKPRRQAGHRFQDGDQLVRAEFGLVRGASLGPADDLPPRTSARSSAAA
jgi:hypothetical protein